MVRVGLFGAFEAADAVKPDIERLAEESCEIRVATLHHRTDLAHSSVELERLAGFELVEHGFEALGRRITDFTRRQPCQVFRESDVTQVFAQEPAAS